MKSMKDYKYHSGIMVRAYPSDKQKEIIILNDNARRYIYNKCIEINKELYLLHKTNIYCKPIQDRITYLESLKNSSKEISNMSPFLNDKLIDSLAKANAIKNYQEAWSNYRKNKNTKIPSFHKKSNEKKYQTNCQYQQNKEVNLFSGTIKFEDKEHLILPKLGRIRIKGSKKQIDALFSMCSIRLGTITIKIDNCNDCFISLQLASDDRFADILPKTDKYIGIDVNIENFYTTSEGEIVKNPKYYNKSLKKLKKEQRKLSKKIERAKKEKRKFQDSKNLQKQRLKVSKIQRKIKRQREEYQHIHSKKLIESQDYIFSEDLKIKNMIQNKKLSKSIADVSWGNFLRKIEYKAKVYDKTYIKVKAKNTTQTCSICKYILTGDKKLTLKDRQWTCPNCGTKHIRDINAAVNILNRGKELLNLV